MALYVYNTLTRKKQEFVPQIDGKVGMYVCGPTVYGLPHVGHAKSYISFDVIFRYLKFLGYKVKYVQNITDVGHLLDNDDDRIIKQAQIEKSDPYEIAYKYELHYFDCMRALNCEPPSISCRATGHIIEIIDMVKTLVEKKFAYVTPQGNVYFRINSFPNYGALSNRTLTDTKSGERITVADDKENPEDFALWKRAEEAHLMKWESPWGIGYPGWHIECSVMAKKYLGATIDIHGGGMDNIFPHHESEIAQSECANGVTFVKYFLHNNLVTVDGQKMGKSLNNFITLPDLFKKYDPVIIRFFTLLTHYRRPLDFKESQIEEARDSYNRILDSVSQARQLLRNKQAEASAYEPQPSPQGEGSPLDDVKQIIADFSAAMDDDFNTPAAISHVYAIVKLLNTETHNATPDIGKIKAILDFFLSHVEPILGFNFDGQTSSSNDQTQELFKYLSDIRQKLRDAKQFELADKIRTDLEAVFGVNVKDGKVK
jgi:cysteinyl-tRNA synthetase